jgi:hypothetical protein
MTQSNIRHRFIIHITKVHAHINLFSISGEEESGDVISQWISHLTQPGTNIFDILSSQNNVIYDGVICAACLSITGTLLQYERSHTPQEIREFLYRICTDFKIQNEGVCRGIIDTYLVIEFHS